jgi:NADH:ubiquinone oxidoreductase subunit K
MSWVWLVSGALGAIGLVGMLYKKTMLGIIVSIQMMVLGASVLFVATGSEAGTQTDGHSFAVFVIIGGLVQGIGGYALATRMFYLKNESTLSKIRELKR